MPKLNILKSWCLESAVEFLVLLAHLLLLGPSSRWLTWGGGWVRMVTVGAVGLWGDWSPRAGGGQQGGPAAHWLMLREGTSSKHRAPRRGPAAPMGQRGPPDEGRLGLGSGRPGGSDVPQLAVRRARYTQWGFSLSSPVEWPWVLYVKGLTPVYF